MEARTHRHQFQRQRSARAPPPPPPPHPRHPNPPRQNPSRFAAAAAAAPRSPAMDDDAITTLMDIDDSPRSAAGAGFLDEEEEAEMFPVHRMGGGGNEARGPLPFAGFYNTFDGADFDDADLA